MPGFAAHDDVAAHQSRHVARQRQAEPGAFLRGAAGLGLHEGFEQLAEFVRGNARSGVRDLESGAAILPVHA